MARAGQRRAGAHAGMGVGTGMNAGANTDAHAGAGTGADVEMGAGVGMDRTTGATETANTAAPAGAAGAAGAAGGRLRLFLRSSAFDFLLVLVLSTALVFTVSYGFESAPELRGNLALEAGVCALLLAVLFAGSWSKKAVAPAAAGYIAAAAAIVFTISQAAGAGEPLFVDGQVNDTAGNYTVFGIVAVVVPALCYLLSRRTWGVAVLFVLAVLACATIQFLYRDWTAAQPGVAASLVVYLACAACYINQRYRQSAFKAHYAKEGSFGAAAGFSVVAALVCLLAGAGLFAGVVAPLGLSTPDIKPFQDSYQRPVIEYSGIYSEQQIDNPLNRSNRTDDEDKDTHDEAEGGQSQDEDTGISDNERKTPTSATSSSFDLSSWSEQFQTVAYDLANWTTLLVAIVLVCLAIGAVLARRSMRELRLKRIAEKDASWQVVWIYRFLVGRFARLGIRRPENLTPLEFSLACAPRLEPFADVQTKTDFFQATLAYTRAAYGPGAAADDLARMRGFYRSFYRSVPHELGRLRWLWKFWRI